MAFLFYQAVLSVNGIIGSGIPTKISFYESSTTHFNRAVCHGSQAHVNFIKLTSRRGQLTVSALNFGCLDVFHWMCATVSSKRCRTELWQTIWIAFDPCICKWRAYLTIPCSENSVDICLLLDSSAFIMPRGYPRERSQTRGFRGMQFTQAAALNARLAELGIRCPLYTTQIKVHQKSTLSFMSLTFMSHYWLYLLILWRDVERSN